jgi:hypothetical protein
MKKNFLTAAAIMVTAFFVATTIAQAADVNFGGQILQRWEVNEQGPGSGVRDHDNATDPSDFVSSRIVLDTKVNVNDTTSAFIQMQSQRTWGSGVAGGGAGANNGSFQVNDQDASVGIHQAYFTLKNFAALPVDLKVGKQEIIVDGHRLFGNTIWTPGKQSHDAVRIDHKHDNMSFTYAWMVGSESGVNASPATAAPVELGQNDTENHMFTAGYKGILGGNLRVIYNYLDDVCDGNASCTDDVANPNEIHTIGFRQAGQLFGIDYRGEYYYQWGSADQDGQNIGGTTLNSNAVAASIGVDREAYMFGVRLGKTFSNVTMKPGITIWYDYLSGTSDSDLDTTGTPTYKSFNTLFDTGHKFYGLMDNFLGIGGGASGNGTAGLGLQDLAIKTKLSPAPGWTLKADYHWFFTAEGVVGNPGAGVGAHVVGDNLSATTQDFGSRDNSLGNELDITLVNKYNANTNIAIGFSNYTATATYRDLRDVVGDGTNWAYVQFDVKF